VATVSIELAGALDGMRLSRWLRAMIAELGPDMLRAKGILHLRNDPDQFLFQGVQMEYEGRPGRAWAPGEERINRLVFIGRRLDADRIKQGFGECLATGHEATSATDPFGRNVEISSHTLDQISYWLRQNFGFSREVPVLIKEVPCMKPGCPPIETAIMALLQNEPPRLFKIQRTIDEITFDHVYDLIENPMPCC
jgi:hypothetical protein